MSKLLAARSYVEREHQHTCNRATCFVCRHEKLHCQVCGGTERAITKECPGRPLTAAQREAIADGELDFEEGKWIRLDGGTRR